LKNTSNAGLSILTVEVPATPIPEPAAWLLMSLGLGLVGSLKVTGKPAAFFLARA
jgi:hypothetical protein